MRHLQLVASILALGLAFAQASRAQDDEPAIEVPEPPAPTSSELRLYLEQSNRVLVTREQAQPPIPLERGQLTIVGLGAFEPGLEAERLLGIRFDLEVPGLPADEAVAYLDLHEIETLLRGLATLREVAAEEDRGLRTEARIVSIEGFGAAVAVEGGRARYQVLGGPGGRVATGISSEGFQLLESRTARTL
ncbi:MAG: hypothetical protein QF410_12705, partial [Planctomycetota bacterium]|nr:hypothetical protein [Planctomycetota bacterium]